VTLDAKFMTTEMGLQVKVNRNSRVNEELTTPYAGASTSYSTAAAQMSKELSQQVMSNEVNRVNVNFRAGSMTGQTANLKDHAGMAHAGTQQAAISSMSRVNGQVRGGVLAGLSTSYTLDSKEMRNYKRNQGQTSAAKRERAMMLGDIGTDGANADAGYHHEPDADYLEIGTDESKFKLSETKKERFEALMARGMGGPDDGAEQQVRSPAPAHKSKRMAQI